MSRPLRAVFAALKRVWNSRKDFTPVYFTACLLVLSVPLTQAQYYFDRYVNIGGEEDIRGILQEGSDGFIWIGTANGLYRYDGRNFKVYHHQPEDSTSLQHDNIYAMLAIGDQLWIGTAIGVSVMDLHTHTFTNYTFSSNNWPEWQGASSYNRVQAIFRDRQGEIWIGTHIQGLWRFDPVTETFIPYSERAYPQLPSPLEKPYLICSLTQSPTDDSIIWVGTGAGLLELNKVSGAQQLHLYRDEDLLKETAVNVVLNVYAHDDGLVYLGNWTEGVYTFDPATGLFAPLAAGNDSENITVKSHIRGLHRKNAEQIWMSTSRGVAVYNSHTRTLDYAKSNDFEKKAFYGISMIDKRGRIWYDNTFGIYLFDPHLQQFGNRSFRDLYDRKDPALNIYVEYDTVRDRIVVCPRRADGLYRYERKTEKWEKLALDPGDKPYLEVFGFSMLGDGQYLLSTRSGLQLYDERTGAQRVIEIPDDILYSDLRDVLLTSSGEIWISVNHRGIYRTDRDLRSFRHYREEIDYSDIGLTHMGILYEDSRQNIWIKRRFGFSVYHHQQDTFHNFIYPLDPDISFTMVNDFVEDRQGRVWTSNGHGMLGYLEADHPEKGLIRKINFNDVGLPGYISRLETDSKGNVWGITEDDMICIEPDSLHISSYSFRYGARDFTYYGFRILPDDKMYIGSWVSLLETDAGRLRKNDELPIPYLSSISIRNETETEPYPLFGRKPLELKHHQNFFTLYYSAQAYTLGQDVNFRYRLRGFDEWKEVGHSQLATYTNVPSGDYVFELQAANNEGIWNKEALLIPIAIGKPWYATTWFYLGTGGFFGLFFLSVYQYRVNQIRHEARLKTDFDKKLASVEMNALLAQMNPHFIFNSLNSIDSFILKNESRQASEYLNDFARLIRLILQNSRSESIRLSDEIDTLELYLKMEQLRFNGKFEYVIHIDDSVDVDQVEIPPMLVQPYVENAVWHGLLHLPEDRSGKLRVDIDRKGGILTIQVTDNGVGRVRSREIKQRKIKHKKSMGMKITHDRIDLINTLYNANARIDIADLYSEDETPQGTKVFITLST
ncbi:sensor histidine kinase [Flavilitoribacter nigricans]|uniref:sensor histidine kinase n=1 Tax=Flavilitoribacter nigricans TaxID=70997 RepID=UPI0014738902|nr:sensor histidine kinase [Flavilitoribacter nigricans]